MADVSYANSTSSNLSYLDFLAASERIAHGSVVLDFRPRRRGTKTLEDGRRTGEKSLYEEETKAGQESPTRSKAALEPLDVIPIRGPTPVEEGESILWDTYSLCPTSPSCSRERHKLLPSVVPKLSRHALQKPVDVSIVSRRSNSPFSGNSVVDQFDAEIQPQSNVRKPGSVTPNRVDIEKKFSDRAHSGDESDETGNGSEIHGSDQNVEIASRRGRQLDRGVRSLLHQFQDLRGRARQVREAMHEKDDKRPILGRSKSSDSRSKKHMRSSRNREESVPVWDARETETSIRSGKSKKRAEPRMPSKRFRDSENIYDLEKPVEAISDTMSERAERSMRYGTDDQRDKGNRKTLLDVQKEMTDLAQQLKRKNSELELRARQLDEREQRIEEEEKRWRWEEEVSEGEIAAIEGQDEQNGESRSDILVKTSEELHLLRQENRKMQARLRSLIASSKSLREKVTHLEGEAEEKTNRIEQLSRQLKHSRDRSQRLSSSISALNIKKESESERPKVLKERNVAKVSNRREETDSVQKIIEAVRDEVSKAVAKRNETTPENPASAVPKRKSPTEKENRTQCEARYSLYVLLDYALQLSKSLQRLFDLPTTSDISDTLVNDACAVVHSSMQSVVVAVHEQYSLKIYKAVTIALPLIMGPDISDARGCTIDVQKNTDFFHLQENFFEMLLSFFQRSPERTPFDTAQKRVVAEELYAYYAKHRTGMKASPLFQSSHVRIRLTVFLIILAGIAQDDIVETILNAVLPELIEPEAKRSFVYLKGISFIHPFLRLEVPNSLLSRASAVILNMCGEGESRMAFLHQCNAPDVIESCRIALESSVRKNQMTTAENLSILLQKLTGISSSRMLFLENTNLVRLIRDISIGDGNDDPNSAISEFLLLNAQSIMQFIDNAEM